MPPPHPPLDIFIAYTETELPESHFTLKPKKESRSKGSQEGKEEGGRVFMWQEGGFIINAVSHYPIFERCVAYFQGRIFLNEGGNLASQVVRLAGWILQSVAERVV
jgi:hypothetical protein